MLPSTFPPQSKIQLYIDRFLIIQQRLRRHRLFRPVQWGNLGGGRAARDIAELTELKALLGRVGERRYVMGFLSRHDEGRYFIEDLSARLPLDVSGAETADGLFTENCIIVAEGELTPGGSFRALALGLPPAEPREESLLALQGLDFFGGQHGSSSKCSELDQAQWAARHDEDRVVLLSEVALDRPEILERLRTIFGAFEAVDPPPSAFVLIGNFQSYDANVADTSFARLRDNFATLAGIIGHYPSLRTHSLFLLVPGPRDVGPAEALPRPSLPRSIVAPLLDSLPNIQLCSNPCRIRHGHMELVIFRSDLHKTMRGLCILPSKTTPDGHSSTVFEHLCATVLQESHMCPVPLEYQPVVWEWDHSLWLYPVPHGLVLADAEPAARFTFDTCSCLNPGSLLEGTFGAWRPTTNEMELCDVAAAADDEEEGEDDVSEIEEIEEENEEGGDVVVD